MGSISENQNLINSVIAEAYLNIGTSTSVEQRAYQLAELTLAARISAKRGPEWFQRNEDEILKARPVLVEVEDTKPILADAIAGGNALYVFEMNKLDTLVDIFTVAGWKVRVTGSTEDVKPSYDFSYKGIKIHLSLSAMADTFTINNTGKISTPVFSTAKFDCVPFATLFVEGIPTLNNRKLEGVGQLALYPIARKILNTLA